MYRTMQTYVFAMSTVLTYLKMVEAGPTGGGGGNGGKSKIPYWHRPCGRAVIADVVNLKNVFEEMKASLKNLKMQHELMMNDYLSRDYEFLYERVRIGVEEHQYIPNWLPGKKDVHAVKKLAHTRPHVIFNHLPKLHTDLQKFAVAIEEMIEDEVESTRIQDALRSTQSYLQIMICEVENSILSIPGIQLPPRIDRDLMTHIEREPVDETRRLIRDWGILLKYKDYLHAWRHVFNY